MRTPPALLPASTLPRNLVARGPHPPATPATSPYLPRQDRIYHGRLLHVRNERRRPPCASVTRPRVDAMCIPQSYFVHRVPERRTPIVEPPSTHSRSCCRHAARAAPTPSAPSPARAAQRRAPTTPAPTHHRDTVLGPRHRRPSKQNHRARHPPPTARRPTIGMDIVARRDTKPKTTTTSTAHHRSTTTTTRRVGFVSPWQHS